MKSTRTGSGRCEKRSSSACPAELSPSDPSSAAKRCAKRLSRAATFFRIVDPMLLFEAFKIPVTAANAGHGGVAACGFYPKAAFAVHVQLLAEYSGRFLPGRQAAGPLPLACRARIGPIPHRHVRATSETIPERLFAAVPSLKRRPALHFASRLKSRTSRRRTALDRRRHRRCRRRPVGKSGAPAARRARPPPV